MATYSSILAWGISWTEEPGGLQSMGSQELDTTQQISTQQHTQCLAQVIPQLRLSNCHLNCESKEQGWIFQNFLDFISLCQNWSYKKHFSSLFCGLHRDLVSSHPSSFQQIIICHYPHADPCSPVIILRKNKPCPSLEASPRSHHEMNCSWGEFFMKATWPDSTQNCVWISVHL